MKNYSTYSLTSFIIGIVWLLIYVLNYFFALINFGEGALLWVALVLASMFPIVGLFMFPIVGLGISGLGILLGYIGLKHSIEKRWLAGIGMAINTIILLLLSVYMILGGCIVCSL